MSGERHEGIQCNGCHAVDFRGSRHKCLWCVNYDLCHACKRRGVETDGHLRTHPMQTILCPGDRRLYFGDSRSCDSFTCPYCGQLGLPAAELRDHAQQCCENSASYPSEMFCPICVTRDTLYSERIPHMASHLRRMHRSSNDPPVSSQSRGWAALESPSSYTGIPGMGRPIVGGRGGRGAYAIVSRGGLSARGPEMFSRTGRMRSNQSLPSHNGSLGGGPSESLPEPPSAKRDTTTNARNMAAATNSFVPSRLGRMGMPPDADVLIPPSTASSTEAHLRSDPTSQIATLLAAAAAAGGDDDTPSGDSTGGNRFAAQFADILDLLVDSRHRPDEYEEDEEDDQEEATDEEDDYHDYIDGSTWGGAYNTTDTSFGHGRRVGRRNRRDGLDNWPESEPSLIQKFADFFRATQTLESPPSDSRRSNGRGRVQGRTDGSDEQGTERVSFIQELMMSAILEDILEGRVSTHRKIDVKHTSKSHSSSPSDGKPPSL